MPEPASWDPLTTGISGSIIFPGDPTYGGYSAGWNRRIGVAKNPQAIARPISEKDISTTVKFAYDNGLTLIARSGANSYIGASNTDGLLLDLSGYTGVSLHAEGKLVTVKSGTRIGHVYDALYYSGYTLALPTAEGGNGQLGIGLALGGGHSVLTGFYGVLAQRIRAARVVLYDGSIVECDNYKNSDLLWALKGGGGGAFGIVSEYTLEPHPIPTLYDWRVRYDSINFPAAIKAWQAYLPNAGETFMSRAAIYWPSNKTQALAYAAGGTGLFIEISVRGIGTSAEVKSFVETSGILPAGVTYTFYSNAAVSFVPPAFSFSTDRTFNFGLLPSATFSDEAINVILRKTREFCLGISGGGTYAGLSGSYDRPPETILMGYGKGVKNDNTNSASFPYKDALHSGQFRMDWAESDTRYPIYIQFMQDYAYELAQATGFQGYCNYPHIGLSATGATGYGKFYWGNNLLPLQQVKKAYDPNNFINSPHSVPPLE